MFPIPGHLPASSPSWRTRWGNFFIVTFLASYAYVGMEWLFIITKPSFMDASLWREKIAILLITGALLTVLGFLAVLPLMLVSFLPRFRRYPDGFIRTSLLLPAAILAALGLLWIDNFSYSLLKFGIATAHGGLRAAYAILFILLLVAFFRWMDRFLKNPPKPMRLPKFRKTVFSLIGLVLLLSLGLVFIPGDAKETQDRTIPSGKNKVSASLPHILWITGDGINAQRMSLYGYDRDTTPNIRQFAPKMLIAENAFTNSAESSGSFISMYTGKSPAQTRVIYPPDILRGLDAYQHLPGILQSFGYRTIQITTPYYMDAYTFNLQDGFDMANGRSIIHRSPFPVIGDYLSDHTAYFLFEVVKRIDDRLQHIFYLKEMENPYDLVTDPEDIGDDLRMDQLYTEIFSADRPLFIHVHLMGPHGPYFAPKKRVFSDGKSQEIEWDQDGYDDSILEFDAHIGRLVSFLEKKRLLDKTILIIGSDHGQKHESNVRIPLMIHFPKQQFAGQMDENVQNLDIPPTLLDYLGIEIPKWMQGQSLLQMQSEQETAQIGSAQTMPVGQPSTQRPIFSFSVRYAEQQDNTGRYAVNPQKATPPFYQFGIITLVSCQRWFQLGLTDLKLWYGEVDQYTTPCSESELIAPEQAAAILIEQLQNNGFDISSLSNISFREK